MDSDAGKRGHEERLEGIDPRRATNDGAAHGQTVPNRKPRARSAGTSSAAASTA